MALRSVGDSAAALAFAARGEGDELVDEFRELYWNSFKFEDAELWSDNVLTDFAFRLSGGRFVAAAGASSNRTTREVLAEDANLFESLTNCDREYVMDLIKEAYIGSLLSVGKEGGATISVLCDRASRCWSARTDDAEGRTSVGRGLDGLTLREVSGSSMRPLASLLHRLGLRSRLGPFTGSGIQAATTKKRLLNFFLEFAPPSTVNGLICLAASPEDGMNLFQENWKEESVLDLEVPEAVAICTALGLSPSSSGSAPRVLALTLQQGRPDSESVPARVSNPRSSPFQGALAVPRGNRPAPLQEILPSPSRRRSQTPQGSLVLAEDAHQQHQTEPESPGPRLRQMIVPEDGSSSDSDREEAQDNQSFAEKLSKLLTPAVETAKSGQSLSSTACRVIRSLPSSSQKEFIEMVDRHRNTVVTKKDLESLREVFLANKAVEEMFLAKRPLPNNVLEREGPTNLMILPLYQCTRLGFPAHLSILAQELAVRTAGGRSLDASLAERQALIKDESIRQEHCSISELLILLLDEMHPRGVLSLRTAERMMRRLVGLEVAAERKGNNNLPLQKSLSELADFMGTGTRVSKAVKSQLP